MKARPIRTARIAAAHFAALCAMSAPSVAAADGNATIDALFATPAAVVHKARKTRLVDARPAIPGEIVVTVIAGEGEETRSPPAEDGDMVVRNRCPATGNEEILVKKAKFLERYDGPLAEATAAPWRAHRPRGKEMLVVFVPETTAALTFLAPWGTPMTAKPGDAILRDPLDPRDTYRVARAAFDCTYEIVPRP